MIVRERADGSLILIGQTDHAKLSGQCAAHWGNKDFARPKPYEAVVRAAMFHDSGWYDYEASPTVAADTGKPLNFMQVMWGKPQRRAFEWAIDWMTRIDPYSGLLVSKHRTGLQRGRYGKMTSPKAFNTQNLPEDNEDFLERNEEAQAAAAAQLRRRRVLDQLSAPADLRFHFAVPVQQGCGRRLYRAGADLL